MVLFENLQVMSDGRVVEVKCLGQLLGVPGLLPDRFQDAGPGLGPGASREEPPEQPLKRVQDTVDGIFLMQ